MVVGKLHSRWAGLLSWAAFAAGFPVHVYSVAYHATVLDPAQVRDGDGYCNLCFGSLRYGNRARVTRLAVGSGFLLLGFTFRLRKDSELFLSFLYPGCITTLVQQLEICI